MPYNPGVVDRSGEILAQGITGATSSLSDTIERLGALHKQTKAYRTMAVDGLGMDPDEVDNMDLPTLQGKLQGVAIKGAADQRKAQIADLMSQASERQNIGMWRQAMAAKSNQQESRMGDFNQLMAGAGGGGAPDPSAATNMMLTGGGIPAGAGDSTSLTPQQVQVMMGKAGLDPDQMAKVASAYKTMGAGGSGADVMPRTANVGGTDVIYNPRTGNFQAKPNPGGAPVATDVLDADGNPTGQKVIPHANGKGFTVIKPPGSTSPKLMPAIDGSTGKPIPGIYADDKGNFHSRQGNSLEQIKQLTGGDDAPAPAANDGKVKMKNPKGVIGYVPKEQVEGAKKLGFKQLD